MGIIKVAILPYNVASEISVRIISMKNNPNIEIEGYVVDQGNSSIDLTACHLLPKDLISSNPINRLWAYFNYLKILKDICKKVDIIHWYWDFHYIPILKFPIEYFILKRFKGVKLITWCGSEIRNPKIDSKINKYYKEVFISNEYEYSFESESRSNRTQGFFSKLGFTPLVFIGMDHYINKFLFNKWYRIYQIINLNQLNCQLPNPYKVKPLIVHSASKTGGKGTKFVLQAIEELSIDNNFEFKLLHNLPKYEAMKWVEKCDIFIDQLITGSHGTAAVEAMAMGKPVLCYINDSIRPNYPEELPIINVNPETLKVNLLKLIIDSNLRFIIGQASRKYVENYHHTLTNCNNLEKIYLEEFKSINKS